MASAAVFFAISFALVRRISEFSGIDAFEQTLFRQVIGTAIMLPFILRQGRSGFRTGQVGTNIIRNIAGYGGIALSFLGITLIPLADAMALQSTHPFFIIIFASVLLTERPGIHRWLAVAIGFIGAIVILRPGFGVISLGMIAAVAAAASFGLSDTLCRKLGRTDSTSAIVFYGFALQLPIALPIALFNWVTPVAADWPWLIAMGVTSFAAQWSLSKSFVLAEASLVSPVLFLRLPIVAVIGFAYFGQETNIWTWVGAVIIFAAAYYAGRRETLRRG